MIFWLALVPLSVLFGDVFRAFNPWRAIGAGGGLGGADGRARPAARRRSSTRSGSATGRPPPGIFAFAALELVASSGDKPENVAIAALVYSAATFVAMALYGVDRWIERGEAFSVYFNLFSRISPVTRRGDELGLRAPLSGLAELEPVAGTVPLLAVIIGSVTFDGVAEAPLWTGMAPDIAEFFESLGFSPEQALEATFLVGPGRVRC